MHYKQQPCLGAASYAITCRQQLSAWRMAHLHILQRQPYDGADAMLLSGPDKAFTSDFKVTQISQLLAWSFRNCRLSMKNTYINPGRVSWMNKWLPLKQTCFTSQLVQLLRTKKHVNRSKWCHKSMKVSIEVVFYTPFQFWGGDMLSWPPKGFKIAFLFIMSP